MLLFGKKEATSPPEGPQSNMVIKSLGYWRQSICPLRFQSPIVKDTKKKSIKAAQGNQAANQAAKRAALQSKDLIGVATVVPQTNFPETPSNTECETLKLRVRAFKKILWGGSKRRDSFFLPGNFQWKLVNSLHATTDLGEKALQRLLESSFRVTGLQTTIRKVASSCPTAIGWAGPSGVFEITLRFV